MSLRFAFLLSFLFVVLSAAVPAHAQDGPDLFSGETLTVTGDARIVGADGEQGWLDGGYGKARFDGAKNGDFKLRPQLAEADIIWQPRFTWSLTGTVVAIAQRGQQHPVDLSEAALQFKPLLPGRTRLTVRAGLYWPAISLEHSGPEWAVTDTITPSAINSWIGDEVKIVGTEATAATTAGRHRIAATLGVFGFNDTAGTLLAFRGWALHDEKATAFGLQPLPPLNAFMQGAQAPETRPVVEIDHRVGWYAKLGWSPSEHVELQGFHYDNRADPHAVTSAQQWGWRTRFDNLGAIASFGHFQLKAQALSGRTEMGYPMPSTIWVDTKFRSAFLLMTRIFDHGSISARAEAFGTRSHGSVLTALDSEDGWALTAAARREIAPHLTLLAEVLHVDGRKDARIATGLAPRQRTNQVQIALRVRI
jgi:hypothetical protein